MSTETYVPDGVQSWFPKKVLRPVSTHVVRYSRGFFRSKPERWFPNVPAQWLALWYSLGIEARIIEVRPAIEIPNDLDSRFLAHLDGEPLVIAFDAASSVALASSVIPNSPERAQKISVEYFVRRLFATLVGSWSGPALQSAVFDGPTNDPSIQLAAAIRISASITGKPIELWMGLGDKIVSRLDGLWRRQLHSQTKHSGIHSGVVHVEVAQLAVPPALLSDYTKSGTIIDLEAPAGDTVTLRLQGRSWLQAKLCDVGGRLGLETLPGKVPELALPEGSTRVSIVLGVFDVDSPLGIELAQPGASLETDLPISDRVSLVINGERVAGAALKVFEGRFAIQVD